MVGRFGLSLQEATAVGAPDQTGCCKSDADISRFAHIASFGNRATVKFCFCHQGDAGRGRIQRRLGGRGGGCSPPAESHPDKRASEPHVTQYLKEFEPAKARFCGVAVRSFCLSLAQVRRSSQALRSHSIQLPPESTGQQHFNDNFWGKG